MMDSEIRESGEKASLFIGLLLLLLFSWLLFDLNFLIAFSLILLQLLYVLMTKRQMYGNSLLVTATQFPHIDEIVTEITSKLGIDKPKVFIEQNPYLNAYAFGFKKPYLIVLSSSLVEGLNTEQLAFVIGHEIGHIYYRHTTILSFISPLGKDNYFLNLLYGTWQRKSEYTADRFALTITKNIKPAIKSLLKLTVGPDLERKVKYSAIYDQISEGELSRASNIGEVLLTHPYILNRVENILIYNKYLESLELKKQKSVDIAGEKD